MYLSYSIHHLTFLSRNKWLIFLSNSGFYLNYLSKINIYYFNLSLENKL